MIVARLKSAAMMPLQEETARSIGVWLLMTRIPTPETNPATTGWGASLTIRASPVAPISIIHRPVSITQPTKASSACVVLPSRATNRDPSRLAWISELLGMVVTKHDR
ncbi:hypothetical protein NKH71_27715 [Mesorhizobium sp. M0983]